MTEPTGPDVRWEVPAPTAGPAPGLEFAPHGPRLVAYLVDTLLISALIGVFWAPLLILVPTLESAARVAPATAVVLVAFATIGIVVALLYFPFFWAGWGQTPGMRPFSLHVVRDSDGARFGWKTALLRLLGLYVASSVFYLGFIWIFVDRRRRGFQDLIAGTIVVRRLPVRSQHP
jgi:uncharacterized RDD family membrane protein YckC